MMYLFCVKKIIMYYHLFLKKNMLIQAKNKSFASTLNITFIPISYL